MTNGTTIPAPDSLPIISVIIPAKNREGVLVRSIESALNQSFKPAEIIVVDDGSTDGTLAAAQAMQGKGGVNIKVIANATSVGAPEARNMGARAATGSHLAFLDSDDAWRPDKLKRQVEILSQHGDTAAIFTGVAYHRGGKIRTKIIAQDLIAQRDLMGHNLIGPTSTCLVRGDAFLAAGGFRKDMPSCQDWELWLRLSQVGPLRMVQEPLLDYFYDGTGQISANPTKVMAGHRMVFDIVYQMIGNGPDLPRLKGEHEMALARLNAMTFHNAPATFRHLTRALASDTSPATLLQAGHYGLRAVFNHVRRALR
nr:glycosyltransferase family 2 protein [uncultured Dongia sp.]